MIQSNMTCDNNSPLNESTDNKKNEVDRVCGLDIHKSSITACIKGKTLKEQIKIFGTSTSDLEKLKDWLYQNEITYLAMESTGIYWKPIFNILDQDDKIKLMLVNAKQLKFVPGRKSDVKDCQWLCDLLRLGLLKGSFVPPEDIRNLRDPSGAEILMAQKFFLCLSYYKLSGIDVTSVTQNQAQVTYLNQLISPSFSYYLHQRN